MRVVDPLNKENPDFHNKRSVVSGLLRKGIVRYSVLLQESHGKQFSQPSCVISQFDRGYGHGHGHGMHLAAMPIWFAPAACG
jgi:hypothetical protein